MANTATPRFLNLLQRNDAEVEEIPLIPVGHYRGFCNDIKFDKFQSKQNGNEVDTVEFQIKAQEPLSDVDPDLWQVFAAHPVRARTFLRTRVFVEEDNLRRFFDFMIEKFGCGRGMTGQQMLEASKGAQCVFEVEHKTSDKTGKPFADIRRMLNAGEATP